MKTELESPEQAGRQLANNHMLRAIIELLAEALERSPNEIRQEIKKRVDHSTAILRLTAVGKEDRRAAIHAMDYTIKMVTERDMETKQ